jgi:hypothetical protein
VPTVDSAVCIPETAKADPLIPSGTTTTVAAVDASAPAAQLAVEGSLTVTGEWDVDWLDVTGGRVVLAGPSVLRWIHLRDGARLVVEGNATIGPDGQVGEDDLVPGLLVVAPSGVLTVDGPDDSSAVIVGGALANHGTVHVVDGRFSVWDYVDAEIPVDAASDGTWTADPGADIWLENAPVLLDGSRLEGVTVLGAHIPSGAVVTASRSHVWPTWAWPTPEPALTGGGELVLTDDSELVWGVADQVTVRIPHGERAALDGWLQDDARAVVEGTATHARGAFAVLDAASLEVAPSGEMTWTDGDATGWELPDQPSQPTGTVVVDEGGTLSGGGAAGALVRGVLDNHGTVRAEGGVLRATPAPGTVADGVLTGGRWEAGAGARLQLLADAAGQPTPTGQPAPIGPITANAAEVALEGAGASLRGLGALAANQADGVLELTAGASLETRGRLRNAGTVLLGATARLATTGDFVQTQRGTLALEVSQSAVGALAAGGVRDLAGTLSLRPEDGAWPPFDTRRTLITSDGRVTPDDAFDAVRAPTWSGRTARVRYGADSVWFRVVG